MFLIHMFYQIWQEVNETGCGFLTRKQFIKACLLVYEHVNNTQLDKDSVLEDFLKDEDLAANKNKEVEKPRQLSAVSLKH